MNKVELAGRLTHDPKVRYTNGGTQVTTMRMAVDDDRGNTSFLNVKSYGKTAETAADWGEKGRQVEVIGKLEPRQWKNEAGENQSRLEVSAERVRWGQRSKESAEARALQTEQQASQDVDLPTAGEGIGV